MKVQHCGRMDKHDGHPHKARPRAKLILCVCDNVACTCPQVWPISATKKTFWCVGFILKEGAPLHLIPRVEL